MKTKIQMYNFLMIISHFIFICMEITFVIKRNVNVTYIYKLPLSDKPVVTKLPEMCFLYYRMLSGKPHNYKCTKI